MSNRIETPLAAIALVFAAAAVAQDQTGQIAGTVVDAVTHQPIRNATVHLIHLTDPGSTGNLSTSTDASGGFRFDALADGRYMLSATHQDYPRVATAAHRSVEIQGGAHSISITLELIPASAITGHVFDEDGDPMPGCLVQVRLASHPFQPRGGSNNNQDGEYRIHGLAPGRYLVSARCGAPAFTPRPLSAGLDPPPSGAYPTQYYPLAADASSAQPVEVAPGAEKRGIDFRVRPAPVTQVRGRIASDSNPAGLSIQLVPAASHEWIVNASRDIAKGTFEFDRVFAGSYNLVAMADGDAGGRVTAVERIEVKDRPVEVVLKLSHGVDVAGTVTVEGDSSTSRQIQVDLQAEVPEGDVSSTPVKEDGTFLIRSVPAGRWKLTVSGARVFLKSAWMGNADVTNHWFDVSAGSEALRIVVSARTGVITGTAPAGEILACASTDDPNSNQHATQADMAGRFTLSGLPPGKYRLGLFDPGVPFPDEGGQEVTVHEGETVTLAVKQP
jgi:hypothetical protein